MKSITRGIGERELPPLSLSSFVGQVMCKEPMSRLISVSLRTRMPSIVLRGLKQRTNDWYIATEPTNWQCGQDEEQRDHRDAPGLNSRKDRMRDTHVECGDSFEPTGSIQMEAEPNATSTDVDQHAVQEETSHTPSAKVHFDDENQKDQEQEPVMTKALQRARKKFNQLDVDGNGVLEGSELQALGDWVWSNFHPGGEPLSEEEKQEQGAKLLDRLDANADGCMSFDEFSGWFEKTCEGIERYRRGLAGQKTAKGRAKPQAEQRHGKDGFDAASSIIDIRELAT